MTNKFNLRQGIKKYYPLGFLFLIIFGFVLIQEAKAKGISVGTASDNIGIGTDTPGTTYRLNVNGNSNITGTLNVTGGITGASLGATLLGASNVSAGAFGSNSGGGNYSFPGTLTSSGKLYLDAAEGLGVYGIRGRNSNEQIEMYNKVSIGSPNGWTIFPQAPNFGLSVYGGANFATNQGSVGIGTTNPLGKLTVNGAIQAGIGTSNTTDISSWASLNANYGLVGPYGYWGIRTDTSEGINFDVYNSGSQKAALTILQNSNIGIGTINPQFTLDVNGPARANYIYKDFQVLQGADANNLTRTWNGALVAGSDNGGTKTYTVIETNVPQDSYMMGGFTIDWMENYSSTNAKTSIKLGGYWNAESNGGFIGFEYTSTNPNLAPTIRVARKTSNGNTVFILNHFAGNYPVIVARDLWLSYSSGDKSYGDNWSIVQTDDISGYTNLDNVVARVPFSNSVNAANVSSGSFASNTGGGNFSFPGSISASTYAFPGLAGDPSPIITARTVPAGQGAAGEKTELILFHSNDGYNGAGPDQITLRAPALSFQTYSDASVSSIDNNSGYNERLYIQPDGNVGIGTTIPGAKLQVLGNAKIGSNNNQGLWIDSTGSPEWGTQLYLTQDLASTQGAIKLSADYTLGGGAPNFVISRSTNSQAYGSNPNSLAYSPALVVKGNTGNIGVGTNNPLTKLHVSGTLTVDPGNTSGYTEGIRVAAASNGYSIVNFGADAGSASGAQANQWWIGKDGRDNGLNIWGNSPGDALHILPNGNLGIGTTGPGYKLDVAGGIRSRENIYTNSNYGYGLVGVYDSTRYQGIFSMGYQWGLAADGSSTGNLYGLAWSHPNAGGVASNLNTHGLLVMENGQFLAAISGSIRSRDDMQSPIFYDRNDTSYYMDPNGTSRINNLTVTGSISGNISNADTVDGLHAGSFFQYSGFTLDANWMGANRSGFTYSVGAPWTGPVVRFDSSNYDLELNGNYGDGTGLSYRIKNGDNNTWNAWRRIYSDAYRPYADSAGNSSTADKVNGISSNPDNSHPGTGMRPFYSWNLGQANNSSAGYSNGISVGSHPGDQSYGFQIVQNMWDDNLYFRRYNGGWQTWYSVVYKDSSNNSVIGGTMTAGGFIYNSDVKLKKNIATIESPLTKILQLRGVTFNWKKDNTPGVGLIAQEVEKVFPELVSEQNGIKSVQYGNLVAPLIEAVKEQQTEIQNQQTQINEMKSQIQTLQAKN